jgi:hypothetical protein
MARANPNIKLVAASAYKVDENCRLELNTRVISDERDYVSNLTKGIRDYWQFSRLPHFLHSQTLPRPQESKFGCDAAIVVRYDNKAKVCLFEAKWPRLSDESHSWDSLQQRTKISHFSDQLRRQQRWSREAAIWELFIHEHAFGDQPNGHEGSASTCIWHRDAFPFDNTYRNVKDLWTDSDLTTLVSDYVRSHSKNLYSVIDQACRCQHGEYIRINRDGHVNLTADNDEETVRVPASLETLSADAEIFCEDNGIRELLFMNVSKEGTR